MSMRRRQPIGDYPLDFAADGHCRVGEGRRTGGGHALKLILLRVFYLTDHFPFLCS